LDRKRRREESDGGTEEGAEAEALEKGLQQQEGSSQKHRMHLSVRKYRRVAEREQSPPPEAGAPFGDESVDGAGSSRAEMVQQGEEQGQDESASPEVKVDFCDEPMDRRGEGQGQGESASPEVEVDFCDEPMDKSEQEEPRGDVSLEESVADDVSMSEGSEDEVEEGGERGDDDNNNGNDNDNDGNNGDDDGNDDNDNDDDDDDGIFGYLFHPRISAVHGLYDEADGMDDEESSADDEESN